jgi:hypothetical protein
MPMSKQLQYEDVEQYLRIFSTEKPPFHFGGLLHLVLAGVENLRRNVAAGDILEHAHFITEAQAIFLQQLLESRTESIAWFKDYIAHSSQTGQL